MLAAACQPGKQQAPPGPPAAAPPAKAVLNRDFPDPSVFRDGSNDFVAFSTNSGFNDFGCVNRVPVATTAGPFGTWTTPDDNPSAEDDPFIWEVWDPPFCFNWAPEVERFGSTYVLYMTGKHKTAGTQCIGAATSPTLEGPYEPEDDAPLVCPTSLGGAIDPSVFIDHSGARWLLWKTDGNAIGVLPSIYTQRLSGNGLSLTGPVFPLLTVSQAWETGGTAATSVVESPEMFRLGNYYYLFYSANRWDTEDYAIGYALCAAPASGNGCTKPQDGPIMATGPLGRGPGGQSLFHDDQGHLVMAYHAWRPTTVGYDNGNRRTLRLSFVGIVPGFPPGFS